MKKLFLFLACFANLLWAQTAIGPYEILQTGCQTCSYTFYFVPFTSVGNAVSIPASSHNQGANVIVKWFDGTGHTITPASVTVDTSGNVSATFAGNPTGWVLVNGGATSLPNFSSSFTSQTAIVISAQTHKFNTPNLDYAVYNGSGVQQSGESLKLDLSLSAYFQFSGSTTGRVVFGPSLLVEYTPQNVNSYTPSSGLSNPMTTAGDLIIGGTSGAAQRLAAGTSGYALLSGGPGAAETWGAISSGNTPQSISTGSPTTVGLSISGTNNASGQLTPAFVQGTSGDTLGGGSTGLVFTSNVTAGDALVVSAITYNSATPPSVSDSLGSTFTLVSSATSGGGQFLWVALNVSGGADTVTVGLPEYSAAVAAEYSGVATASALDAQSMVHNSSPVNPRVSNSITTTSANDLLLTVYGSAATDSASISGGGFTQRESAVASSVYIWLADTLASSVGSYSASWANDTSGGDVVGIVALKAGLGVVPQSADLQDWKSAGGTVLSSVDSSGNINYLGNKGHHFITEAAANDLSGTLAISSSTSASLNFTTPYSSAPACILTPTSDPTSTGTWWATTSTSALTAHVHTSGSITFNYLCFGNPN